MQQVQQQGAKMSRLASLRLGSGALGTPALRSRTMTASLGGALPADVLPEELQQQQWDASFQLPVKVRGGLRLRVGGSG